MRWTLRSDTRGERPRVQERRIDECRRKRRQRKRRHRLEATKVSSFFRPASQRAFFSPSRWRGRDKHIPAELRYCHTTLVVALAVLPAAKTSPRVSSALCPPLVRNLNTEITEMLRVLCVKGQKRRTRRASFGVAAIRAKLTAS